MSPYRSLFVTLLVLVLAGAAAPAANFDNKIPDDLRAILEKGEQMELLSLNPDHPQESTSDRFHGWKVLGKTKLKTPQVRKKVVAAFEKGVAENMGVGAACFMPRHGIRVTHEGKTADFVICFECLQVEAYSGNKDKKSFLITDSPAPVFDEVLKDAKVPLAPKPKE